MKSYTDIEQSRKLAEILPLESADMYYSDVPIREWIDKNNTSKGTHVVFKSQIFAIENLRNNEIGEGDVPAWSLAALLATLPKIGAEEPMLRKLYYANAPKERYICQYSFTSITEEYYNPIDPCYEMILKLHELNLL